MEASHLPEQNIRILQIYNIYRLLLVLVLLVTFLTSATTTQLGIHDPGLFIDTLLAYGIFSLLVMALIAPARTFSSRQYLLSALFIVDIFAIGLITYSCRGVVSGLGLLHLVTIAAGGILVVGRISTFLAAIASIVTIYSEVYLSFTTDGVSNQYVQSGLLGVLLFATSLFLQTLAERMRRSAALTVEQATSIVNLEQLNHVIIQRMRTGIMVVDNRGSVITTNDAANRMLSLSSQDDTTNPQSDAPRKLILPEILEQHLIAWKQNPGKRLPTFQSKKSGPQLQASFAYLNPNSDSGILIFLEDSSQFIQRVRQMKLASLGRLTASIAHEIRNPLGAISHASQLLQEAEGLSEPDRRLLDIVLNHCARVNLIIEDVLHMSRQKQDSAERINLHDWLMEFVANYCESHEVSGTVSVDIKPRSTEVRIITSQFEQILNNLFENGLRYSAKATGTATLKLKGGIARKGDQSTPVLHVIDEGHGVDATSEEQLFEPFHTTEATGTGLGLYISKELCEANQAQLSYRRTRKGKSCFSIHFSHPDRNVN
ncbi:MAG: histidine kinase dimerization/phospho-acceptor domain-containing protein [Gammaproteobacteria bacterium]|nr:histidine kinase dimerization/phospho-acceptor domain-containing protein [Gammaproteobacteria bacterium]